MSETGFWRPGAEPRDVEVLLAHPTGIVAVCVGEIAFHKIELVTDVVASTETAEPFKGLRRLYGHIEGEGPERDLGYAVDIAAVDQPLQSHPSARLVKIP